MAKSAWLKGCFQATYILENVIQNFTDFQMLLLMLKRIRYNQNRGQNK
jgi:hypothetical protein